MCGSRDVRPFLAGEQVDAVAADLRITDSRYGRSAPLFRCMTCDFVYADPLPASDLVALYADLDDPDYLAGRAYRRLQMERLVARIRALVPNARTLLDVGAATGLLVEAARDAGIDAVGVEPSRALVDEARRRSLPVHEGILPCAALGDRTFDVVACVDVIEHVSDVKGLLDQLAKVTAPGGAVVLLTPDVDSCARRVLGRRWWHFRVAHVCFLSTQAMAHALASAGLRPVHRERPVWWFAASYLMARVGALLRARWLGDRLAAWTVLDRILVPLDLKDSWLYVCSREGG